ncbi:MAG: peptidoglycan-binding protein [Promicromonosporaceae bacterium]|nr:peptidoglycan-binding protein [Promicromonosporaceae bacterium]
MKERRGRAVVGWLVALMLAAGLGVLFGRWAFVPPAVETAAAAPATVAVAEMTVEQSMPVAVFAEWEFRPLGVGAAAGTLTSLEVATGEAVSTGGLLYTVDLRPVFAAEGAIPAFRDLASGARGADVTQLQEFLIALGRFNGEPSGVFGASTNTAVRAWQREVGLPVDGVVRAGDLLFTESLPARVIVAEGFEVGRRIGPGDVVLSAISATPDFLAHLSGMIDLDPNLPIEVTFDGEQVTTVVTGQRGDLNLGNQQILLARLDGTPVCGTRCDLVPLDRMEASFPGRQVAIAPTTGPGVPASALWLRASGEPFLLLPDGTELPVIILAQGQGRVILDGVEIGQTVVLPHGQDD